MVSRPAPPFVQLLPRRETFKIPEGGSLTVGRSASNDVVIAEGHVSDRHCSLRCDDGAVIVEDLGSKNGTWRGDGKQLTGPLRIRASECLFLGHPRSSVKPVEIVVVACEAALGGDTFVDGDPAFNAIRDELVQRVRFGSAVREHHGLVVESYLAGAFADACACLDRADSMLLAARERIARIVDTFAVDASLRDLLIEMSSTALPYQKELKASLRQAAAAFADLPTLEPWPRELDDDCGTCGGAVERTAGAFEWSGKLHDGALCPRCRKLWPIIGEEIQPLRAAGNGDDDDDDGARSVRGGRHVASA